MPLYAKTEPGGVLATDAQGNLITIFSRGTKTPDSIKKHPDDTLAWVILEDDLTPIDEDNERTTGTTSVSIVNGKAVRTRDKVPLTQQEKDDRQAASIPYQIQQIQNRLDVLEDLMHRVIWVIKQHEDPQKINTQIDADGWGTQRHTGAPGSQIPRNPRGPGV